MVGVESIVRGDCEEDGDEENFLRIAGILLTATMVGVESIVRGDCDEDEENFLRIAGILLTATMIGVESIVRGDCDEDGEEEEENFLRYPSTGPIHIILQNTPAKKRRKY